MSRQREARRAAQRAAGQLAPRTPEGLAPGGLTWTHMTFSGPLPPPKMLAQYNDAVPGAAERIIAMAERQAAHRQTQEARLVNGKLRLEWAGLGSATALSLVALAGAIWLLLEGRNGPGYVLFSGVATLGAGSLIRRAWRQYRDLRAKAGAFGPQTLQTR